jgi:hypothetical protein
MIAEEIIQRRTRALVGHMHHVALQAQLEQLVGKIARRAGAGGGEGDLLAGFDHLHEVGKHRVRRAGGHRQGKRHDAGERNGDQVLVGIVALIGEQALIDGDFGGLPDEERVAVRRRRRDVARTDGAAGARAVLHDDRLVERLAELLGDDARNDVAGAARRLGHDQMDRLVREGLGRESTKRHGATHGGCNNPGDSAFHCCLPDRNCSCALQLTTAAAGLRHSASRRRPARAAASERAGKHAAVDQEVLSGDVAGV